MIRFLRFFILACPLWFLPHLNAAQPEKVDLNPTEFKAAILSKVAPYVQWPEKAFAESAGQIVIGILGKDPFDGLLNELLKETKVNGRPVVVKTFEDVRQVGPCHILFIPASFGAQWQELSKTMDTFGILTVGESEDFIKMGGVFNLSVQDRKLEIHLKNAKKAGLGIDSKLLKIAKTIKS